MDQALQTAVDRIPFLRDLPQPDREVLLGKGTLRILEKHQNAWAEGGKANELLIVLRGAVKLVQSEVADREVIVGLGAPGTLLCGGVVREIGSYCCSCAALEAETEVLVVDRDVALDLAQRSSSFAHALLMSIANRCQGGCSRISGLSSGQVERRIGHLLVQLAEELGTKTGAATRIPLDLVSGRASSSPRGRPNQGSRRGSRDAGRVVRVRD